MNTLTAQLNQQFTLSDPVSPKEGLTFITAEKAQLVPLITTLKAHHGYKILVIISALDWLEKGQFQLTYILNNPDTKQDFSIRVFLDREEATMDSIHDMWEHAATFQREIKEMFGIDFPGSPRVNDSFLLEGWDDMPPMRRDFDTKKYAEETYFPRPGRETNDPASYMKQKLYPDE